MNIKSITSSVTSDTKTDYFDQFLKQKWEACTRKLENKLGKLDFKESLELGKSSADRNYTAHIINEIESRKDHGQHQWLQDFSSNLRMILQETMPFSLWVAVALGRPPESMSLFWGLFHLLINCSSASTQTASKFTEHHTDLRKAIHQVVQIVQFLPAQDDVREGTVDFCINLMTFWVTCIKFIRTKRHTIDRGMSSRQWAGEADPWSELNMNFKKLISESDHVLVSLRNMADLAARESMVSHTNAITPNVISIENVQFPVFVLPIPENPGFFGRRDILERINDHINPSKKEPGFRCYTVYGTGGVGKTQVALAYVYLHRDSFDAIFWINSENKVSIRQSFLEIALSLQLPGVNQRDNAEQVREAVDTWLRTTSRSWLLLFDNVESWDNILNYWPRHPGSAIITSRDYRLAGRPASEGEQLDTFSDRESFDFFKSSVESWSNDDCEEAHAAKKLLTELDGLPLAIDQIAGLIKLYEMSVQEFLELYEEESAVLHSERGIGSDIFYPKSLDMVWKVTFENFSKTPSTLHLLGVLSLLSTNSIPQELFEPALHFQLPEHLKFCRTQLGLLKEIQKLRGAALIKKTSRSLQIHRLTQNLFIQHAETSTITEIFFSASLLLGEAFPKQRKGDPMYERWAACQKYIQHGQSLAKRFLDINRRGTVIEPSLCFIELLSNCAWFLHETDEVESCGKLLEAAYLGCELYRGDKAELDIVKSHLLNTDALIAWQSLDYKRTEESMQQAADIRIKRLSPDDDRIAGCINNLGNLWAAQGKFDKALTVYLDSEARLKESNIPTCVDLCRASLNLARLYRARGNFDNAREKLREAETYLEDETMSMMPLWVAAGEFIAGDIHKDLEEFAEAKSRYQRALELREKHQPGDATVAATAYKLASVLLQLGETQNAKNLLTSGLSIAMRKKSQGNTGRILELLEQTAAQEHDSQSAMSYRNRINAIRKSMDVIYGQVTFDGFSFFDPYISFFDR